MASKQDKYNKKTYDEIKFRVPKGKRVVVQGRATEVDKSLNAYMVSLIEKDIQSVRGPDFSLTTRDTTEE